MHHVVFAVLALWTSMAWAVDAPVTDIKQTHAGFKAFQAAEQKLTAAQTIEKSLGANLTSEQRKNQIIEKTSELQNQAYDQCKTSIAAYSGAPADAIDVSALYFCLVSAIENCETPSTKPSCDMPIRSVLQMTQKQLTGKAGIAGLNNLIANHYTREKRYADAMVAYFPAYSQVSKAPCSKDHVNQLLTILNLQLESGDQNGFNQYWKVTAYCQGSGLMQPKGATFVRDTTLNHVTLQMPLQKEPAPIAGMAKTPATSASNAASSPSSVVATAAPVIPRELPAKVQVTATARTPTAAAAADAESETDTDTDDSETEATAKTLVAAPVAQVKPAAKAETSGLEPTVPPAAQVKPSPKPEMLDLEPMTPSATQVKSVTPVAKTKPATKPEMPVAESETAAPGSKSAPTSQETALRKPAAPVPEEVFSSVQEFIPGLLKGIAKNNPEWEAALAKRRAKKDKDENEVRELEEIAKAKKENEKKAMDQMLTSDPDSHAKQLKNVLSLHLGDSMQKVKTVLGKPSSEMLDDHKLTYDQLNTGATVGDVIAGKLPAFVGLVFTFSPQGQLHEITYSYPQGHGNVICR